MSVFILHIRWYLYLYIQYLQFTYFKSGILNKCLWIYIYIYIYIYTIYMYKHCTYITVVGRPCLPFISSSPTPHITINFSTPTPQHMLPSSQMSCPITCPHSTLTHFTFNFPLAIFLVIHLFLLPMFSPVLPIHVPNFLRIFSSPAFPIPQANIACSIFSPI